MNFTVKPENFDPLKITSGLVTLEAAEEAWGIRKKTLQQFEASHAFPRGHRSMSNPQTKYSGSELALFCEDNAEEVWDLLEIGELHEAVKQVKEDNSAQLAIMEAADKREAALLHTQGNIEQMNGALLVVVAELAAMRALLETLVSQTGDRS